MSGWQDPYPPDTPMDVRHCTDAITHVLREHMEGRGLNNLGPVKFAKLYDALLNLVRSFDTNRTEHIAFLKSELMRMHDTHPTMVYRVIKNPDGTFTTGPIEGPKE